MKKTYWVLRYKGHLDGYFMPPVYWFDNEEAAKDFLKYTDQSATYCLADKPFPVVESDEVEIRIHDSEVTIGKFLLYGSKRGL